MKPKAVIVKTAASQLYTLADQKIFSRISTTSEDDFINSLIKAATEDAESFCRIAFLDTVFTAYYDYFPSEIELPKGTVSEIASIKYYDTDNQIQTISESNYDSDLKSKPAIVIPATNYSWPDTYCKQNAVEIEYTAGYGASNTSVPNPILIAVKLMAGTVYDGDRANRRAGNSLPTAAESLLKPYIQY